VIAGLVPLTIACGSRTAPLTDAHKAAIADTTKAVLASVLAGTDKLDFPAALKPFSSDPDARFMENGTLYPSLEAMRKAFDEFAPILDSLKSTVDAWDIVVLADDAASFTLPMHFSIKPKGRPAYTGQYVWSGVVQRRAGTWQIIQSHESRLNFDQVMAALAPPPGKADTAKGK
jgi:hypothetical protein